MYIMKVRYLTSSGSARLARETTADQSRVHCQPPWSCRLSWHCSPSRTADRLLRALLRIPPLQCLFNIAAFFLSHMPRHVKTESSRKAPTCTCLNSSRSAAAAIIVRAFSRGKLSRQHEHDCGLSVQLPPSPTVSRTTLPSQSRSST
jgi:hypothetical protein